MDWGPKKIRVELLKAGVSQKAIADAAGVTRQTVYKVIEGVTVSDRVRQAIADALGRDVAEIWPATYLKDGPRGPGRPRSRPAEMHQAFKKRL